MYVPFWGPLYPQVSNVKCSSLSNFTSERGEGEGVERYFWMSRLSPHTTETEGHLRARPPRHPSWPAPWAPTRRRARNRRQRQVLAQQERGRPRQKGHPLAEGQEEGGPTGNRRGSHPLAKPTHPYYAHDRAPALILRAPKTGALCNTLPQYAAPGTSAQRRGSLLGGPRSTHR